MLYICIFICIYIFLCKCHYIYYSLYICVDISIYLYINRCTIHSHVHIMTHASIYTYIYAQDASYLYTVICMPIHKCIYVYPNTIIDNTQVIYIYIYIYIFNKEKRELLVVKMNFSQLVSAIGRFQGNLFWTEKFTFLNMILI